MLYDIRVLLFILSYIMVIRLLTLDRSKVFYWYAVLALGLGTEGAICQQCCRRSRQFRLVVERPLETLEA